MSPLDRTSSAFARVSVSVCVPRFFCFPRFPSSLPRISDGLHTVTRSEHQISRLATKPTHHLPCRWTTASPLFTRYSSVTEPFLSRSARILTSVRNAQPCSRICLAAARSLQFYLSRRDSLRRRSPLSIQPLVSPLCLIGKCLAEQPSAGVTSSTLRARHRHNLPLPYIPSSPALAQTSILIATILLSETRLSRLQSLPSGFSTTAIAIVRLDLAS